MHATIFEHRFLHHEKNGSFLPKKTPERYSPGEIQFHPSPIGVNRDADAVMVHHALYRHFQLSGLHRSPFDN